MLSQERRMERYRILYVWKILENRVPNCGVAEAAENKRLGRRCAIPSLQKNGRRAIQSLREQTLQVDGARLFNVFQRRSEICTMWMSLRRRWTGGWRPYLTSRGSGPWRRRPFARLRVVKATPCWPGPGGPRGPLEDSTFSVLTKLGLLQVMNL